MKNVKVIVVEGDSALAALLESLVGLDKMAKGVELNSPFDFLRPFFTATGRFKEEVKPDLKANPDFYTKPDVKKAPVCVKASSTDPAVGYQIRVDREGNLYCGCKGFKYRGTCRHIDSVKVDGFGTGFGRTNSRGFTLCLNCQNFNRGMVFNGRKSCNATRVLTCPPRNYCDSFTPYRPVFDGRAKVMPDTFPRNGELIQTFNSRSKSGVIYEVKRLKGDLVCTCPSYNFRGNCKHVEHIARLLKNYPLDI